MNCPKRERTGLLCNAALINVSVGSAKTIWAFISLPKGDSKVCVLVKGRRTFRLQETTAGCASGLKSRQVTLPRSNQLETLLVSRNTA